MSYSDQTLNGVQKGSKRLSERLHSLADELSEAPAHLSHAAKESLARANKSLHAAAHDVSDRARYATTYAHDRAAEHPFAAIGAAAGIGILVGFLLSRRS